MIPAILVILVLAMLCFGYGLSCNGKGPSAGCAGIFAHLIGVGLILIDCILFAFWLGTQQ